MMTPGVINLPRTVVAEVIRKTAEFGEFSADNDRTESTISGSFKVCSQNLFWKIDYHNPACEVVRTPSDSAKTTRVLTLILASEY